MADILFEKGNEVVVENFLNLNFEVISQVIKRVDITFQKRLAETLFPVYEVFNKLKPFVRWTVEQEVKQTYYLTQLFRGDTFAVQLINNLLFGDLGIKYLKFLLVPIIEFVKTQPEKLLLVKEPKKEHEIVARNKILNILDELIERMEKSLVRCPIFLRDLFAVVAKTVDNTEFKDGKPATPFVLSFIFFRYVCPVLINPLRYGVVEEEPSPDVSVGLVSISKLLNDLSLYNKDKYDKRTGEWINSRFQRLCVYLKSLLNEEEIEKAKVIIESSVEPQKFTNEEKIAHSKLLKALFNEINPPSLPRSDSETSITSLSSFEGDLSNITEKFLHKMNHIKWKFKHDKPTYKCWEMKGSANSLLISKVEFTINRPLKEVAHTFLNFFFNTEYNSNFSQIRIYTIEECHDETNFLAHGIYKIPVPFQDRDLCASVKLINVDEETALIVFENNDFMPLQKSYIRSYTGMSGFLFKKVRVDSQTNRSASPTTPPPSPPIFQRKLISLRSSRNGSEKNSPSSSSSVINPPSPKLSTGNSSSNLSTFVTQVTHVFHLDLCGGIPKWVINSLTSKNLMSCLNIKNQFEMETFPLNSKKLEFYSLKDVQNEGK